MDSTLPRFRPFATRAALMLAAACWVLPAQALNHVNTVAPTTTGPFTVACSNIAQVPGRIAPGASASDYWEGRNNHYITDLLANPQDTVRFAVAVPDDDLYPGSRGRTVDFVAIVCYPTPNDNSDPDYVLPGSGDVVPHMQPAGAAPKLMTDLDFLGAFGIHPPLAAPTPGTMRMPLILFSHGLTGSPISKGYVGALVTLASYGYMVAAPFHGDPRFSRVRVEDFTDFIYLLTQFDRVVEMQLMRPLSLKAMTDRMLSDPGFAPAIDADRIGGFGASLGGEAMLHLLGARITATIGRSCRDAPVDPRVKAAVGFVPYAGQTFLPTFCDDQTGAAPVTRPFLALSGTADTTAPIGMMKKASDRMRGTRYLVELKDVPHEFVPAYAGDLFTWMVTFLNAYLEVPWDPEAMARFIRMKSVQGGPSDNLIFDVHVPPAARAGDVQVREFHNQILDHFFIAANPVEVAYILTGGAGPGWSLTGQSFLAWLEPPAAAFATSPVCRFYGGVNGGPNSHFFTAVAGECDFVKRGGAGPWFYEGIAFYIRPAPQTQVCPDGYLGVGRAYNNGAARNDSNHRLSTSDSTMREMQDRGWTYEGTMMCARP